jgi:hypothetical protein
MVRSGVKSIEVTPGFDSLELSKLYYECSKRGIEILIPASPSHGYMEGFYVGYKKLTGFKPVWE